MIRKTKILFIHHGIGIGGAPISLRNLMLNLDKEKYKCKVLCLRPGKHVKLFEDIGVETEIINAPHHFFSHTQTGRKQWYYLPIYIRVFFEWIYTAFYYASKYLKDKEYDLIHLNSHVLSSWAFAAKKCGFKVILHNREAITRGYLGIRYSILKYLISHYCDYVINISNDNKKRLGLKENSDVVYNFIDIPENYRIPMTNLEYKKILYLGGTASIKGFDTVVDSLKYLDKDIIVKVAGNINKVVFNRSLKNIIKYLMSIFNFKHKKIKIVESANNVELLGLLNDPYPFIDGCDILITPFKIEHFSRPAIEAFAYGKPVIGSDVEGMDEIIDHGINGLLVNKSNPIELANAINILCKDPCKAQLFGENGRSKAIELFSVKVNIKKIEEIYSKVLGIV